MKLTVKYILLALVLVLAPHVAGAATWKIDPDHSQIMFQVRHLGLVEVKGFFRTFQGTVTLDNQDITKSTVNVKIDAASIDTGVAKRDEHLKSADFFDVAKHPTITFVSTKVAQAGQDRLQVTGDLTINGITRAVTLHVTDLSKDQKDPWGNIRRGVAATATINRPDFGLTYNKVLDNGVLAIGNKVTISLEAELVKDKDK